MKPLGYRETRGRGDGRVGFAQRAPLGAGHRLRDAAATQQNKRCQRPGKMLESGKGFPLGLFKFLVLLKVSQETKQHPKKILEFK